MKASLLRATVIAALLGMSSACDLAAESQDFDITLADCENISDPFSGPGCSKPATMTEAQIIAKCEQVAEVAFSQYPDNKDCSGGVVLGPGPVIGACTGNDDDRCRLNASNGPNKWPAGNDYSECLNDWFVYCGNNQPGTLGIGENNSMCFADFDEGRVDAGSATGRELCQNLESGSFPDPCDTPCGES